MQKFMVISYDTDQQQWFYDTVFADSGEDAEAIICGVRPYVVGADATNLEQLHVMAIAVEKRTESDSWADLLDFAEEANVAVHECGNCGEFHERDKLNPIKDIEQRVAPDEPMPSGECPDCGALCHPNIPGAVGIEKAK